MIYRIKNKYYIRVAPLRYTEINFLLKNNDVVIQPTKNRIEATGDMVITEINFQNEKEKIKQNLLNENNSRDENITTRKYRKRG